MAGVGDAWGTREEMLHPRDSHGRFRSKWKMSKSVVDRLMKFLGSFNPKTFGNDQEGGFYLQELGRSGRISPGGTAALGKFLRGTPAVQTKLRSGDTSSPEVKAIDGSMTPLPDDLILTRVTGPEAWGLTPESIGQVEEYTGHLVADKGYTPATIGTPLPHSGPAVTMTIATPAGTKAAIPRSNGGREVILDRDQPLRITKVDPDGKGGFYVLAVAETKGAPGTKRTTPIGGKVPAPQSGIPESQRAPVAPPSPDRRVVTAPPAPAIPPADAPPTALVPQKKIGRPAGPPPPERNEGHVAESIGGKPVPQGETPAPTPGAPEVPAEPIPQQPGLPAKPAPDPRSTFRGAFKKADLKVPSEGKRRQQFNDAYLGTATGKKTPQEAVETLENHITLNEAILKSDKEDGTDSGPLPNDIKAQKDLAQLIKDHFGLEGARTEEKAAKKAPAPKKEAPAPKKESMAEALSRLNAEQGAKIAKADADIARGERERKGAIRKEMRARIPAKAPESDEARLLAEEHNRRIEAKDKASDAAAKAVADKWLADAGISRDDLSDFELTGLKIVSSDVASKKISGPEGLRRLKGGKGNLAKIGAKAPAKRTAAPKKAVGPIKDDLSNATIAQLREEAKKRGITIPSSVRRKEDIRQHILGDKQGSASSPETPATVKPVTTIEPAWATTKGHGGSGTMLYYGRGKKPDAEPRRVKVNFEQGLAHFADAETGEKMRSVGVASKYWAAPDAPLKKVEAPETKKATVEAPKASTPSAPEKASGTAKGKLTAARVAPGTRILVRKDAKGEWAPTSTKTGATAITVTSKDASTAGGRRGSMRRSGTAGYVITGKDDDGNEITIKPVTPSQTFWLHEKKEPKAPAVKAPARKAAPKAPARKSLTPKSAEALQERMLVEKPWTDGQRKSLTRYASMEFDAINSKLRGTKVAEGMPTGTPIWSNLDDTITEVKGAMRPLPEDVNLHRRVGFSAFGVEDADGLRALQGKTLQDKAFMSTTIASRADLDKAVAKGRPVVMDIHAPAGTPAAYIGKRGTWSRSNEMLLDAGTKYRIDDVIDELDGTVTVKATILPDSAPTAKVVKPVGVPEDLQDALKSASIADLRTQAKAMGIKVPASAKTKQQVLDHIVQTMANREIGRRQGVAETVKKAAPKPSGPVRGEAVLAAAPATLHRAPRGHYNDYSGEALDAPEGAGSVRALSEYEGVEYERTNNYLRGLYRDQKTGKPTLATEDFLSGVPERIAEIDKTMKVSRLTSDVEVHRGVKSGMDTFGRDVWTAGIIDWNTKDLDEQDRQFARWEAGERPDLTGLVFTDKGFVSTSADPKVADEFVKSRLGSTYGLEGEPVVMSILVPKGTGGVQLAEWGHAAEILLERGLSFEVVQDHGVDEKGYRRLVVRVAQT